MIVNQPTFEKNINDFRTIAEMSDRINLPRNIVDRANNLFKVLSMIFYLAIQRLHCFIWLIFPFYPLLDKEPFSIYDNSELDISA